MGVYKRGNSWYIDYYLPNGQRVRESVGKKSDGITKKDAEKALSIKKTEIYQDKYNIKSTKKPVALKTFIKDEYLPWAKDNHKDFDRDKAVCKHFIAFFKNKDLSQVNLRQLEKYKRHRKSLDIKPATINRELVILHRIMTLAVEWEFIQSNPIKGMKKLKVPPRKYRKLKDWEFKKLYDCAEDHLKPILLCGCLTGMRKDEVRLLKWEDVDLEEGYIWIMKAKNNELRGIPIAESLLKVLRKLKKNNDSEYVFLKEDGEHYKSRKAWEGSFKKALAKSGIEYCTFHDIRRSFISISLVDEKEDFRTIMDLSGHKDIRMLKIYAHTDEDAKKKVVGKLDKRFSSLEEEDKEGGGIKEEVSEEE